MSYGRQPHYIYPTNGGIIFPSGFITDDEISQFLQHLLVRGSSGLQRFIDFDTVEKDFWKGIEDLAETAKEVKERNNV